MWKEDSNFILHARNSGIYEEPLNPIFKNRLEWFQF
jgi:hypothetical protein